MHRSGSFGDQVSKVRCSLALPEEAGQNGDIAKLRRTLLMNGLISDSYG
jgi:hypothetical protein